MCVCVCVCVCVRERERERERNRDRGRERETEKCMEHGTKKEGSHRRETERVARTLPFLTLLRAPE